MLYPFIRFYLPSQLFETQCTSFHTICWWSRSLLHLNTLIGWKGWKWGITTSRWGAVDTNFSRFKALHWSHGWREQSKQYSKHPQCNYTKAFSVYSLRDLEEREPPIILTNCPWVQPPVRVRVTVRIRVGGGRTIGLLVRLMKMGPMPRYWKSFSCKLVTNFTCTF